MTDFICTQMPDGRKEVICVIYLDFDNYRNHEESEWSLQWYYQMSNSDQKYAQICSISYEQEFIRIENNFAYSAIAVTGMRLYVQTTEQRAVAREIPLNFELPYGASCALDLRSIWKLLRLRKYLL